MIKSKHIKTLRKRKPLTWVPVLNKKGECIGLKRTKVRAKRVRSDLEKQILAEE